MLPKHPLWLLAALLVAVTGVGHASVSGIALPSLAPMIKGASPAVVNIATRGLVTERVPNPLMDDPFFRRFYNAPPLVRRREFQSVGSGVIVDAGKGYIVTNRHLIVNAREITVTLLDKRQFDATVVGSDEATDIAVLKTDEPRLIAMPLADSSRVEVGDWVVAIGNPFGLQHTVTVGIVSALGRTGLNPQGVSDFIQTDASINPGNSGGALVNLDGRLVGINSAILSRSGGSVGIGFAIPVNMVKAVMEQLVTYGEVRRGAVGLRAQDVTPELAQSLNLPGPRGALITAVAPGSAAERAGIRVGDAIISIDGVQLENVAELRNALALMHVGQSAQLRVARQGRLITVVLPITDPNERRGSRPLVWRGELQRPLPGSQPAVAG